MSLKSLNERLNRVAGISRHSHRVVVHERGRSPNDLSLMQSAASPNQGIMGGTQEISAAQQQYQSFRQAIFSAYNVIARRVGGQPFYIAKVGAKVAKNRSLKSMIKEGIIHPDRFDPFFKRYRQDDIEIVESHPVYDLIETPNEVLLSTNLWWLTVVNFLVTGRTIWIVDIEKNQLVPVPTTWATPVHKNGLFSEWAIRPPNSAKEPVMVPGQFVMNVVLPDPENPFHEVLSGLDMNMDEVVADKNIATAHRVSFQNQIHPRTAIIVGDAATGDGKRQIRLTPDQRKQIISWMRQEFAGASKYGLPMILDAMIKDIKELGHTPSELGFLDSMNAVTKRIFTIAGVPLSAAGMMDGSNYGSSGVGDHSLVTNTVNPLAKLLSEGITRWVLPLYQRGPGKYRFWIEPAEAYDPDLEIKRWNVARQCGAVTRNDVRVRLMKLPPVEGWDDVLVQGAMRTVPAGEQINIAAGGAPAGGEGSAVNGPPTDAADPANMNQSRDEQQKSRWTEFRKDMRSLWTKVRSEAQNQISVELRKLFSQIVKSASVMVVGLGAPENRPGMAAEEIATRIFSDAQFLEVLKGGLRKVLRKEILRGAVAQLLAAEKSYETVHRKVLMDLPQNVRHGIQASVDDTLSRLVDNGFWRNVGEEVKQKLSFTLQEGMLEGDTVRDLANRIEREMGPEWGGKRADLIARTESGAALNAGHYIAQKELEADGLAFGSEWSCMNLPTSREDHVDLDGVRVKAGEDFDVGGTPAPYPGYMELPAKERCNCLCLALPVMEPF